MCNFRNVGEAYTVSMKAKDWFAREKYVVLHGQSWRFRVIKYLIIISVVAALSFWKGWTMALIFLLCLAATGTAVHFLFRWKTKAWTQSWGPYKKLNLPD